MLYEWFPPCYILSVFLFLFPLWIFLLLMLLNFVYSNNKLVLFCVRTWRSFCDTSKIWLVLRRRLFTSAIQTWPSFCGSNSRFPSIFPSDVWYSYSDCVLSEVPLEIPMSADWCSPLNCNQVCSDDVMLLWLDLFPDCISKWYIH